MSKIYNGTHLNFLVLIEIRMRSTLKPKIMGEIKDKKKFKRKTEQKHPTNPNGMTDVKPSTFDIDKKTIKEQQSKK